MGKYLTPFNYVVLISLIDLFLSLKMDAVVISKDSSNFEATSQSSRNTTRPKGDYCSGQPAVGDYLAYSRKGASSNYCVKKYASTSSLNYVCSYEKDN